MKNFTDEPNEGNAVEEFTVERSKRSKRTQLPDGTPLLRLGSKKIDGDVIWDDISFREKLLSELKFPRQAFHRVSRHDVRKTRVAEPIAFFLNSDGMEGGTRVLIEFYERTYVVTVVCKLQISRMCTVRYSENSSKFNMRYDLEQGRKSGIDIIKQFILSTMDDRYLEIYDKYYT